jgi:hypothetical protein
LPTDIPENDPIGALDEGGSHGGCQRGGMAMSSLGQVD